MPHVGVVPPQDSPEIPYAKRKYDILFSGTYYRPQDRLTDLHQSLEARPDIWELYQLMYQNLLIDSDLNLEQALLLTLKQKNLSVSADTLRILFSYSENVDWAIRMTQRERVITVLAEAGLELYLLGRGWENLSCTRYPNVHRINDRIPYGQTLAHMANAKINLNVFPWFKSGTHDRVFNTLLQHSLPLTDRSAWAEEYFTDGEDIAFYDLKHLERLPEIAQDLLDHPAKAEAMIEKGYEKVRRELTWKNCADWILDTVSEQRLPKISDEIMTFGNQIKQMVIGLTANGQWEEAYRMIEQLQVLLPGDPEVLNMRREIMGHIL